MYLDYSNVPQIKKNINNSLKASLGNQKWFTYGQKKQTHNLEFFILIVWWIFEDV